ncbi:hypothetical protein DID88_009222 [Monilinia fructigena]|uniref:Uncharacterized protein n=1 Tax=Monilinia fructigena TaxID=38457 RepID=A0A395IFJ1_9HELO|nr:hypothetical protein DID88_009222 [Monilinia fructigena]
MADLIMDSEGGDKGHQSVLDVDRDVLNTIVNEKNIFSTDIIDISSGDEVDDSASDDDESTSVQPSANTTKLLSQQMVAPDYVPLLQGVVTNQGVSFKQDRVQHGRIIKPRACNANKISGQINRRQQSVHVPIPQDRAARSGPGQIRQFESTKFIDRLYSPKSLDSKGIISLPHHKYAYILGQRNLPCLPFFLQITLLRSLQMSLESMCYRFVEKWLPKVLKANEWDCPDAIELSYWWRALDNCQIPIEAIGPGLHRPLGTIFRRVKDIRHFAVHRLPDIAINSFQDMITDALDIAKMFRDDSYVPKLKLWREKLEYFLRIMLAARGNLETARELDSINTLKENNTSGQDKLNQEIVSLEMEVQVKRQQLINLQQEYQAHCTNENEVTHGERDVVEVQSAERFPRSLSTLKWLEECFTLDLDRDAPNVREAASLSGQLIELKTIGSRPIVAARTNIDGSEDTFNADAGPRLGLNGIPGLGQRAFSGPVLRSHVREAIPSTAFVIDLTEDDF